MHEQDNDKVIRGKTDHLIAREKGWNTYTRINDDECSVARDWWDTHQVFCVKWYRALKVVWVRVIKNNDLQKTKENCIKSNITNKKVCF